MRASHLATALTAFTAGLSAAALLSRRAERRDTVAVPAAPVATPVAAAPAPQPLATPESDGVVLPFLRTVPAAAPAAPARCGETGGLTRSGAPCGGRATVTGRCHHHPVAA